MPILAAVLGTLLLLLILWDGFETMVLPRRVSRKIRLTALFYRAGWKVWSGIARRMAPGKRREALLSIFGPLSLILLLLVWASGLIAAFGLLGWAAGTAQFWLAFYYSGSTFITLGLGDIAPHNAIARFLTVLEAGTGFGLFAMVIGYLPVLYGAFSRREVSIALLDARAGSPPTASELLRRQAQNLETLFYEWEHWSAELLESHISYMPVCYFRSQHDNQAWLTGLTAILDACSVVIASAATSQAQLTFAMARHAVVDLAQVLNTPPVASASDRLPAHALAQLPPFAPDPERLAELRRMYEPYVNAMSAYLMIPLPAWIRATQKPDNWQTSAWERPASPFDNPH